MIRRNDLLDDASPEGLEVYQLTSDPALPACHVYMEAQIFTPDSRYFLLQTGVRTHGSDHRDPRHQYFLCEVESGCLSPVTDEPGVTAPSICPLGHWVYYFVNESEPGSGRILLRRRRLDGSEKETLHVLDAPLPGTRFRVSNPYSLSTISPDGQRLAISCFLGDGVHASAPYGLLVFHLGTGEVDLVLHGPTWCNMHPQYSRSLRPEDAHNLLVQENHGSLSEPGGRVVRLAYGRGADIHLIRDDGLHLRNLPWGRMPRERATGHQCWRGQSPWVIGGIAIGSEAEMKAKNSPLGLMESLPVPYQGHEGGAEPEEGTIRNEITRSFREPHFNHFATDAEGTRLVSDFRPSWDPAAPVQDALWLMELGAPGHGKCHTYRHLLRPGSSWKPGAHVHPALSPDGRTVLFNSDETGETQAYLVRLP